MGSRLEPTPIPFSISPVGSTILKVDTKVFVYKAPFAGELIDGFLVPTTAIAASSVTYSMNISKRTVTGGTETIMARRVAGAKTAATPYAFTLAATQSQCRFAAGQYIVVNFVVAGTTNAQKHFSGGMNILVNARSS